MVSCNLKITLGGHFPFEAVVGLPPQLSANLTLFKRPNIHLVLLPRPASAFDWCL